MRLLLVWLINAVALLALPYVFPFVHVAGFGAALVAALILGLINTLVRPVLVLLTLPATVLTLGLFIFVINGLLFWLVGSWIEGFRVDGFWAGYSARSCTASSPGSLPRWPSPTVTESRTSVTEPAAPDGRSGAICSFEFFPPRTAEGKQKLRTTWRQLAGLEPAFFSVTYGAGGSTREGTLETVLDIREEGWPAAPHLSCIGARREGIHEVLGQYRAHGIRHVVALRGDLPSGAAAAGDFRYASDLVAFIREETGDWFHIDVAAYPEVHPQARTAREDLDAFRRKVDAGADSAITQYFFNADAYWRFVDSCADGGIAIPVVPGIMPIGSFAKLARFSDACGAEIPRWVRKRLESFGDDTRAIQAFGLDVVTELCARLLERGAPGLHFYTLNQAGLTTTIWQRLGL